MWEREGGREIEREVERRVLFPLLKVAAYDINP